METKLETVEPTELEVLDIEAFAREYPADRTKPCARFYIIRIDRERKRVGQSELTGAGILALVGKTPETHKLFQKFCGGETEVVKPCDAVSFVKPGVERLPDHPEGHDGGFLPWLMSGVSSRCRSSTSNSSGAANRPGKR